MRSIGKQIAAALAVAGLIVAVLVVPAADAQETPSAPANFGIAHASQPEPGMLAAGQPTAAQLQELARAGYKTVIDLRAPGENRGFDEAQAAREAGLTYVNVPVTPKEMDESTLDGFSQALRNAERPVLVHCATANRVGGIYYAWLVLEKGESPAQAMARARAAGLRSDELARQIEALTARRQSPH